jgi:hypothetical protein
MRDERLKQTAWTIGDAEQRKKKKSGEKKVNAKSSHIAYNAK